MSSELFFLCSLCFIPLLVLSQINKTIHLNTSLTAGDNSSWVSPSNDFAFGFQPVQGGYLLAIWFNKIPEKTITWSANRDHLAQIGSVLHLNTVGNLVLTDPNGNDKWGKPGSGGAATAAMLDTGNFVVYDSSSNKMWQSFDEPTDTILPSQTVKGLVSQLTSTNYSTGRFNLTMTGASLVFNTLNWPENSKEYFAYETIVTQGGIQVASNQSGVVYIADANGSAVAQVFSKQVSQDLYYQRSILEFDGVFRKYVYPKPNSTQLSGNWTVLEFTPQDICSKMFAELGGGACGFNSYCQIGVDQRPKCLCPQGFSVLDEMDHLKGCKPDFAPQSCSGNQQEQTRFQLIPLVGTNFWGFDYDLFLNLQSEASCRESCLSDCFCAAVVFNGGKQCYKKRFPLADGWNSSSVGTVTYIKTGNIELVGEIEDNKEKMNKNMTLILVESLLLGGSVVLNVVFIILAIIAAKYCVRKWKTREMKQKDIPGTNMRNFSYFELEEATNGFSEVIGHGAFATVYKGSLDFEEGKAIAVKKLNQLEKENQREFESEVKAIARTGHRNLVQLIGICNEEQHRLLVYKYMPNGSLADILFNDQKPSWSTRIKFAFETARGLNYLHEECSIQIIHCDIKPQNVLLDENLTVNISDFGLAKLLKKDQTQTVTGIRGTKGYVAPEWFKSMPVTTKVDVYSYGVLLLELICCRRCFIADIEDECQMILADWAYDCYKEGVIEKLVENDNDAMADLENVKKLVMVALWCIHDVPSARPSMKKVVQMIEDGVDEAVPEDLASYISYMNGGCKNAVSSSTEAFSDA